MDNCGEQSKIVGLVAALVIARAVTGGGAFTLFSGFAAGLFALKLANDENRARILGALPDVSLPEPLRF